MYLTVDPFLYCSKLFEIVLHNRIYMPLHYQISIHQHGFMTCRSTQTNLTNLKRLTGDSVLKQKLQYFGFSNSSVALNNSYLSNRLQSVSYNGYTSLAYKPHSEVLQESNLGLLWFSNLLIILIISGKIIVYKRLNTFFQYFQYLGLFSPSK